MTETSDSTFISTKLRRIAELAREMPQAALKTLAHHIDVEWLREAYPEYGSPQGGVVSPILSNAYLHEVLDTWFEQAVKPRLKGRACLIRYADDAVMVFAEEGDARRVMEVLPKRFVKYGLTLHPEKTRLVPFNRPRGRAGKGGLNESRPGTFDLLGFTHYWGKTRKGNWAVKRKTAKGRFARALKSVAEWCRRNRHLPIREQWKKLVLKLRGHFAYYGIAGNSRGIGNFRYHVVDVWRKWLSRRSRSASLSWGRFHRLLERFPLPAALVVRPRSVT